MDDGPASVGRRLFYGGAGVYFLAAGMSEVIGLAENAFLVFVEVVLGVFFLGWGLFQPMIKQRMGRLHVALSDAGVRWKLHQLTSPHFFSWEAIDTLEWTPTKLRLVVDGRTYRITHPKSPQETRRLHEAVSAYAPQYDVPFHQWDEQFQE